MKRTIQWTLAGGAVGLSAIVGLAWPASWLARSERVEGWLTQMPPIVVQQPALSLVDLGLVGIILILLGTLAAVLMKGRFSPEAAARQERETRMMQDLFRGFVLLEERLEALETTVLRRAGRVTMVPPVN